jgi:hypothetical protein
MPAVDAQGVGIEYEVIGQGLPVVLPHGYYVADLHEGGLER